MKLEYLTSSPGQTQKLGKNLAKEILKIGPSQKAYTLGLIGDLGGGKTTFLQGLARGLGIKERILSPTFIIMRRFSISNSFSNFYHIDCYRIQKPKELLGLEFKKIISNPQNIVVIEWADRVQKIIPKEASWINFHFQDERKRKIVLQLNYGEKAPNYH